MARGPLSESAMTDGSKAQEGGEAAGAPVSLLVVHTPGYQPSQVIAREPVSRKISPSRKSYFDSVQKSRFQSQPSGI